MAKEIQIERIKAVVRYQIRKKVVRNPSEKRKDENTFGFVSKKMFQMLKKELNLSQARLGSILAYKRNPHNGRLEECYEMFVTKKALAIC